MKKTKAEIEYHIIECLKLRTTIQRTLRKSIDTLEVVEKEIANYVRLLPPLDKD